MEIEAKNKVKFKIGKDAKRRIEASPDILETEK
jgi:nucleoid DNA-binding protein